MGEWGRPLERARGDETDKRVERGEEGLCKAYAIPQKQSVSAHIEKKCKKRHQFITKGVVYYAGFKSIA